ncbi:MAG: sulfur carrier protein ThiS [Gemmatimonadota bacterium]|nr:sulfur carrier protein ThiS [Gemmatimonadota bacterium]
MTHTATRGESGPATIVVNGESRQLPPGSSLGDLLRSLAVDPRMVVIERNRVILRHRDTYDTVALDEGDAIEIVHFVGGG